MDSAYCCDLIGPSGRSVWNLAPDEQWQEKYFRRTYVPVCYLVTPLCAVLMRGVPETKGSNIPNDFKATETVSPTTVIQGSASRTPHNPYLSVDGPGYGVWRGWWGCLKSMYLLMVDTALPP